MTQANPNQPAPAARPPEATPAPDFSRFTLPPRGAAALRPPVLPVAVIERLLSRAMARGADFAEVYVEEGTTTSLSLEDDRIRSAQVGVTTGVGIRAIHGAKVGYAYSDDLDGAVLDRTADTAAAIAAGPGASPEVKVSRAPVPTYYAVIEPLAQVDVQRKLALLAAGNDAARAYDRRIVQVMGGWYDQTKRILVANTDGRLAEDVQDLCRLHYQVVARGPDGERRTGFYGAGGRVGIGHFDTVRPEAIGREAARQAVTTLGAVEAPAGPQTVVLAPGWSGILLHEAIGHGLEADFIRKGTSLYAGQLGERVAAPGVTVIDDGTVAGARGSVNVDDEGAPGERKVLIEDGILRGYLYDRLNAKLLGVRSTGSGRRESFQHAPLPRMTNTFLAPGDHHPDEIVASVPRGLYLSHFGGGQVDISNGNFVFEVSEAYLIEHGRLTAPVKNAIIIGVGPEVLRNVSMIGCDPAADPGLGTCGKDGQSVPVGVGLPTLRIDNVTVGGTAVGKGA
jgi:TldD protein